VLVGGTGEGADLQACFAADPVLGYDDVGVVDPGRASVTDVLASVRATGANGEVIATTEIPHELSNRLARDLTEHAIHVELSSSLRGIDHRRLTVGSIGDFPFVYVEPVSRQGWRAAAKRTFDVVVAGAGLLLTAPVLVAAAVAIKVDSPGPVLFHQERIGRHGRRFRVLKLRTMVADAESRLGDLLAVNEADGPLFKMARDPRVTRVGRWLRLLSLDELPQLWNVLRGEMSLVGPRPALPREVVGWLPQVHERLRVKPGVTGMWQVHGRSLTTFDDYVRYDLYYVDNWSLTTDAAILFRTIPAVVLGRGAC
jgi:exopolysaccharide biosynthesis polyprenyl glycosylphosphotransferase